MRRPIAPVGLFEGYVLRSVSDASEVAPAPLVAGAHAWRLTVPAEAAGVRVTVCGRCAWIHAERLESGSWVGRWRRWDAKRAEWEVADVAPPVCLPIRR